MALWLHQLFDITGNFFTKHFMDWVDDERDILSNVFLLTEMNRFRLPVTIIRSFDPPLNEFCPSIEDDAIASSLADQLEITTCKLVHKVKSCEEN